jgi:hypothetical protein
MPGKYSEYYDAPWNDIATVCLRWTSSSDQQMVRDTYNLGEMVVKDDVEYITADYLIANIDLAFKVWQEAPWGKYISFDAFCEEILPYRVSTEPLENWREKALASFADPYKDLLKNEKMTAVEACCKINDLLPRCKIDPDFPPMSYSQLMATAKGTCANITALAAFSMRALGIPVTIDFTVRWAMPFWSRSGHSWNSVRDSSGNHISFMGADSNPYQPHQGTTHRKSKAYRRMYAKQQNISTPEQNIPPPLRGNFADVSAEHTDMANEIELPVIHPLPTHNGYAFLATRHAKEWYPVAWGETDGKTMRFANVGKGVTYLPVWYADGVQTPAGNMFWLDSNGKAISIDSNTQKGLNYRIISGLKTDGEIRGCTVNHHSDYIELEITESDPNLYTHALPENIRLATEVYFNIEYQTDRKIVNAQLFYGKPGAAAGMSSPENLVFEKTGLDATNEAQWAIFKFDCTDAVATHGWGDVGHRFRWDVGNYSENIGTTVYIKKVWFDIYVLP